MAYCKHCGSKFVPVQNVCTQYGTCVINEFKQSPSLRNNIKIQITIKIFKEIEEYATKSSRYSESIVADISLLYKSQTNNNI